MLIPYLKAHGAGNDFLFTFEKALREPLKEDRLAEVARAICHRHNGVGADGWYLIRQPSEGHHAELLLFNSDGSKAELSGNGTRCAAALLVDSGLPVATVRMLTGAGPRVLKLLERNGREFRFDMDMGRPQWKQDQLKFSLPLSGGKRDVTILDVGNPQCVVVVDTLDFDWRKLGAEIESHAQFPKKTNVSFIRKKDDHAIEARFWERGAGATLSSGTGSLGAAVAAILLGLAGSPVKVIGEAGEIEVAWGPKSAPTAPKRIETPAPAPPPPPTPAPKPAAPPAEAAPAAEAAGSAPDAAAPAAEAVPGTDAAASARDAASAPAESAQPEPPEPPSPPPPPPPPPPPIVTWVYTAPEGNATVTGPARIIAAGEFYWP